MFMRDQYSLNVLTFQFEGFQSFTDTFTTDSGIDKNVRVFIPGIQAIPAAAAGNGAKLHGHLPLL